MWGRRGAGELTGSRNAYLTTATYKERVTSYRTCMERGRLVRLKLLVGTGFTEEGGDLGVVVGEGHVLRS